MLKKIIGCAVLVVVAQSQAQAQQRIEHVGSSAPNEVATSSVDMRTDLMTAARTIFPSSWSGFAQKGIDVRRPSNLRVAAGEPWVSALDRWLAQEGIAAKLDWNARKFYLRGGGAYAPVTQQYPQAGYAPQGVYPGAYQGAYQGYPGGYPVGAYQGQPIRTWSVLTTDVRLETTMERWAREGGYKLVWDADRHILISAADSFNGTISDAINRVLSSPAIRDSDYPLEAVFYANTPPVIRITRLGDQPVKE